MSEPQMNELKPAQKKRRRPFWFWATIVFVVGAVLYGLSYGGTIWLTGRQKMPDWAAPYAIRIYRPFFWIQGVAPGPIRDAVMWYTELFMPPRLPPEKLQEMPSGGFDASEPAP